MTLFLVRHGRSAPVVGAPAETWDLDPSTYDDVWALRDRLPADGVWATSPEPKALQTASLLHDGQVAVVPALAEHRRGPAWLDDFEATVARAFAEPDVPAHPEWEPLAACRDRVAAAVRSLLEEHAGRDLVLVGHGTAWTALVAELTRNPPDLDRWRRLAMPDLITIG